MKKDDDKKESKKGKHPNSLKNLRKIDNSDPKINEAKSRGKIKASAKNNILETLRTHIEKFNLIEETVKGVFKEVKKGKYQNAIKLIDVAKEKEAQNIKLNGGVEVQKVFIDKSTKEEADEHIDNIINDN